MSKKSKQSAPYEDAIKLIDCSKYSRLFGVKGEVKLWLVKDSCGIVCAIFTWLLILYAEYVIFFVMLIPAPNQIHSLTNGIIFQFFATLAVFSHLKAMLTDPGAVPRGNATQENIDQLVLKGDQVIYKCTKCISIKPERAHHCSVCRRCIRKMDHHCPW